MSRDASTVRLREHAERIFRSAVAAADPFAAVTRALGPSAGKLQVADVGGVRCVALGKAACTMIRAAASALSSAGVPWSGLAVVNHENSAAVEGARVLTSGHPYPDADGVAAAAEVARFVGEASDDELLLVLISGGGSAILPAPADGISLEDKLATTELLLACGASIQEINTVRKHLSYLKGGGLARRAGAGQIVTLILSDVIGDDLSTIASGPTVGDPTSFEDARRVLVDRQILGRVPVPIRARIDRGCRGEIDETPKPGDDSLRRVSHRLVGSNGSSLDAAAEEARRLGYRVEIVSRALTGEARDVGAEWAGRLPRWAGAERVAILAGGETTVTLRGDGRGGRNQEMALAFAVAAGGIDTVRAWTFLSGGTDGIDGPTDAAGGIVDRGTIRRSGNDESAAEACLERNDSYTFLGSAGDLLVTGATGTNVADVQVLLIDG